MAASDDAIAIHVGPAGPVPEARTGEPIRLGVPLADGWCTDPERLTLTGPGGRVVTLQARALDRWPSGAVRWVLLDFLADSDGGPTPATCRLARSGDHPAPSSRVTALASGDGVEVMTGPARFVVRREASFLSGGEGDAPARVSLSVTTKSGPCAVTVDHAVIEDEGPVRAVVLLRGAARQAGADVLTLEVRLHFFASLASVRADVMLRNPKAARHPGGFWELGEPGSVALESAIVTVTSDPRGPLCLSSMQGEGEATAEQHLELFQASSGGEQWNLRTHADRSGEVPLLFRGFRVRVDGAERSGLRATPVAWTGAGDRQTAIAMPEFWQQCPKAIEAEPGRLTLGLFPRQHASGYELQPGEQKTHTLFLGLGRERVTATPLDWARAPSFARAEPAHYCATGAFPWVVPQADEPSPAYAALVAAAIDGPDAFEAKREIIDEYGWRDFGDLYADHERVYYKGPVPVVSHYNNQYDAIAGFARQFARSGDVRWWRQLCQLARHVVDVDIYHTVEDKAAYNHGLFWHTGHYTDVGLSTHRSYPRAPGISGGGPSCEHNYGAGLLLHYFLTGEIPSRDASLDLARWVVDMDDGRKTVFRWLSAAPTGLASATYSADHHGPGRGAGNSIAALLDGFRITGERRLLDKAETLIRRCVHPDDDIPARGLLDIERRWSYTVFLHALGRYLDVKAERNELDVMYAYACVTLDRYAHWMAAHELPYLDRRDQLEFPTETWAAQEMWKSEVFTYAARYGSRDARPRFLERADFFFDYAMRTLTAAPTRTLTRPVVLLLSRGLMHGYVATHPEALDAPAPPPVTLPPPQPPFRTQKDVAMRRAVMIAVAAAVLVPLAGLYWWLG